MLVCRCPERFKPVSERAWTVLERRGNSIIKVGIANQLNELSLVCCGSCGREWQTRAKYVMWLEDVKDE